MERGLSRVPSSLRRRWPWRGLTAIRACCKDTPSTSLSHRFVFLNYCDCTRNSDFWPIRQHNLSRPEKGLDVYGLVTGADYRSDVVTYIICSLWKYLWPGSNGIEWSAFFLRADQVRSSHHGNIWAAKINGAKNMWLTIWPLNHIDHAQFLNLYPGHKHFTSNRWQKCMTILCQGCSTWSV